MQLKYRNIEHVVNCEMDLHGHAKEGNITYLKIDPEEDTLKGKDPYKEAYKFINSGKCK